MLCRGNITAMSTIGAPLSNQLQGPNQQWVSGGHSPSTKGQQMVINCRLTPLGGSLRSWIRIFLKYKR